MNHCIVQVEKFDNLEELYEIADKTPQAETGQVYGKHPETDEWQGIGWRQSIWMEDQLVGDTSANNDWYNIINYDEVLETTADAVSQHPDIGVNGRVQFSDSMHKMSAKVNFEGGDTTIYAEENDPIDLGLQIQTGHTGHTGVKMDVGAERQICSNGMTAFVSDFHREQTHQDPLKPGLIHNGVDAVLEGTEKVEKRIEDAQNRFLENSYEALLVMTNFGLDQYVDVDDLQDSIDRELEDREEYGEDREQVSLYTTYQAATRGLTHNTRDEIPEHQLDQGFEQASKILEYGQGIPHPDILGENAVETRVNEYLEDPESDEYWDGEQEQLRELMEAREIQV